MYGDAPNVKEFISLRIVIIKLSKFISWKKNNNFFESHCLGYVVAVITVVTNYYNDGKRKNKPTKASVTYPDGTTQDYQYDKKNQITKLVNQLTDKRVISTYQYTYDGAGNQLTKIEEKGTTTYQYDSLNRLSKVAEPEGKVTSYTYDKAGNRITEQVEIGNATVTTYYTYNEQNRLMKTLTSSGEETVYLYDKNGNLTSKSTSTSVIKSGELLDDTMESTELPNISIVINRDTNNGTGTEDITTYSYNHYNRMTQMKSKDVTASYLYNAQGYRVEKVINGNTTSYLYCCRAD